MYTIRDPNEALPVVHNMLGAWSLNVPVHSVKLGGLANDRVLIPSITGACPGAIKAIENLRPQIDQQLAILPSRPNLI